MKIHSHLYQLLFLVTLFAACKDKEDPPPIIPVDMENELIWSKSNYVYLMENVKNLGKTASGEYIASGLGGFSTPFLVKFSSEGDTLWTKQLPGFYNQTFDFQWFHLMKDDNYLIANDSTVVKYDPNFNKIWEIKTPYLMPLYTYVLTNDNGVMLEAPGAVFVKYDANGIKEWEKNIPEVCEFPFEIIQANDGGYVFLSCLNEESLIKTDAAGNFLWKIDNYPYTSAISATSDNGLLALVEPPATAGANCMAGRKLFAEKIDANGNLTWSTALDNGCYYAAEQESMEMDNRYVFMYINFTPVPPIVGTMKVETLNKDGARLSILEHGLTNRGIGEGALFKAMGGEASDGYYTVARILKESSPNFPNYRMAIDKVKIN